MSALENKIKSHRTVKRDNCESCGNPWFFEMADKYECTTCAKLTEKYDTEALAKVHQTFETVFGAAE